MPPSSAKRPKELNIQLQTDIAKAKDGEDMPPISSPIALEGIDLGSFAGDVSSTNLTSLPQLPSSPPHSPPRHTREPSRNLLAGLKTRTPSEPQPRERGPLRQAKDDDEHRPGSSSMSKVYHLRKNPGSTPELSLVGSGSGENVPRQSGEDKPSLPNRPRLSPHHSEDGIASKRKEKGFRNPLARTKSVRRDSNSKSKPTGRAIFDQAPPNTAPLSQSQPSSDMFLTAKKERRGKSAERPASESEETQSQERVPKVKDRSNFVTGGMNVMSKAKTGGNAFFKQLGKIGRSSSNSEKDVPDSEYVFKVINLPLMDQARVTRISKQLGECKDKTEYWMPSLPWRCIDYLNLNCESEGLYRVPGSGPQVKHWQRKFDSEMDVDLLGAELYDPNTIASVLKSWLRELPEDIFPKQQQIALARTLEKRNPNYARVGEPVPKELRDTLSNLSPYNYYLLFAVTCHLSLLLSHHETNRMDLHNLNICIGPALGMERWLFNYLVGDWRHCWQGCFTEKQTLEAENAHAHGMSPAPPPKKSSNVPAKQPEKGVDSVVAVDDERAIHSSGSGTSTQPSRNGSHYEDARSTVGREMSPAGLQQENPHSDTYKPAGSPPRLNNQKFDKTKTPERKAVAHKQKGSETRPKTSDGKKGFGEGGASDGSSTPKTRHYVHSRSQSDLPMTPTRENFKLPERAQK